MSQPPLSRILYVEDDPDIQKIGQVALEVVGGFTVGLCRSGQEALDKAPDFQPQLILIDVMMPEMDGPTTLARLREMPQTATTPAVFLTAKVQPGEVAGYLKLGAIAVIAKPFDPMTLADQVRAIWEKRGG